MMISEILLVIGILCMISSVIGLIRNKIIYEDRMFYADKIYTINRILVMMKLYSNHKISYNILEKLYPWNKTIILFSDISQGRNRMNNYLMKKLTELKIKNGKNIYRKV